MQLVHVLIYCLFIHMQVYMVVYIYLKPISYPQILSLLAFFQYCESPVVTNLTIRYLSTSLNISLGQIPRSKIDEFNKIKAQISLVFRDSVLEYQSVSSSWRIVELGEKQHWMHMFCVRDCGAHSSHASHPVQRVHHCGISRP